MLINTAVILVAAASGILLFSPRLFNWTAWRAMVTPLASIIGSGFLVLGPILAYYYGMFAPIVMIALCVCAYCFGSAIRYNIQDLGDDKSNARQRSRLTHDLEIVSSWALALAYIVSVTYYLNLFGSFSVSLTRYDTEFAARLVTTLIFVIILLVGWLRGFKALEHLEYVSVVVKLAIIAGVITGLCFFFSGKLESSTLVANMPRIDGWTAATLAFGLIITVQGFETSRYLGETYDAETRIKSMKLAQWFSSAIYLVYTVLLTYSFAPENLELSETAIIGMMEIVAPVLPVLLVAAALAAQFSAAIADTSGSGGLFVELTKGKISSRHAYALLTFSGLLITWSANIFEVISYASRAFAVYYGLQCVIASLSAHRAHGFSPRTVFFALLAVLAAAIFAFGLPVEG
ncbi:MAG: hypothetical protein HWE23_16800 [Rhodobacteraceae bacterium]|nr:hypothetical protein [Paracoccaceae bacterium]